MSAHKFAPMTAGLLARKGEAVPAGAARVPFAPIVLREPAPHSSHAESTVRFAAASTPVHEEHSRHSEVDRPHKLRVALSDTEFEKLGLAAVKHGLTRHQLIRDAIDSYVDLLIKRYQGNCRCIGGDGPCASESHATAI